MTWHTGTRKIRGRKNYITSKTDRPREVKTRLCIMHAETETVCATQKTWNTSSGKQKNVDLTSHPTKSVNLQFCHLQWKSVLSFICGCTMPQNQRVVHRCASSAASCHNSTIFMTLCYGNRTALYWLLHQLPNRITQASVPTTVLLLGLHISLGTSPTLSILGTLPSEVLQNNWYN